jgi:hypothetical protein
MTFPVFHRFPHIRTLALATCVFGAAASHAQTGPALAKLEALQASPEPAGALVYWGATFPQKTPSAADPLYRYERRVVAAPTEWSASHITRDPAGRVIILESATLTPLYEMRRFEAVNQQVGFSGTVQLSNDGRHLTYELNDNGKVSKATEVVSDPVVSGPSLFGFILKNWKPLQAGASLPVRMLVLKEKTTYGFDIKAEQKTNGQASFTIIPSSFLIRMAIAPMRVVFDVTSKTPVRYEGRVPPMENASGKLKDLDARVEYTQISPAYR